MKHPPRLVHPLTEEQSLQIDRGKRYTLAEKVQVLTFLSLNVSYRDIHTWIGVPPRQSQRILQKAKKRGYNPEESKKILHSYVEEGLRSGRPRKNRGEESETAISNIVTQDRIGPVIN